MVRRYAKKSYRRKRTIRRKTKRMSFGSRVKKVVNRIAETKYKDYYSGSVSVQYSPDQYRKNLWAEVRSGAGQGQREGVKIQATWLRMRMELNANGQDSIFIRLLYLQWKGMGIIPQITTLPDNYLSYVDQELWTVIKDQVYNMGNGLADGRNKRFVQWWIKINRTITYDADDSGDYAKPAIFVAMSNDAVVPSPFLILNARMYFKDI